MLRLPADISALLAHFAPLFSRWTWRYVPTLVAGVLLAPGRRMVSSALLAVVVVWCVKRHPLTVSDTVNYYCQ